MARADSVALDFHKWFYVQFEAGCVLVRHPEEHWHAFAETPEYLASHGERGLAAGSHWPNEYGLQLSRSFRALKLWMTHQGKCGAAKYARTDRAERGPSTIPDRTRPARAGAGAAGVHRSQHRLLPLRCHPASTMLRSTRSNHEILIRLHEGGVAVPTYTTLRGRYALRAAITNHRSRREDFDLLRRRSSPSGPQSDLAAKLHV